jgi:hypothetical protein
LVIRGDRLREGPPERIEGRGVAVDGEICTQTLLEVNDFSRFAAARGADVVFVFPAYPREEFDLNRDMTRRYELPESYLRYLSSGRPERLSFSLSTGSRTP